MKVITWKQFGVFILLVIGFILAFSPLNRTSITDESAKRIAKQITTKEDHISAEELGQLIIDGDPDFTLIDLRNNEEYNNYHIKQAINLPLESLFESDVLHNLDKDKLLILYSNGGTHAAQAWVLLQQEGFTNSVVLLGGINYWVDVYTNPTPPEGYYADSELFRYQFLASAGPALLGTQQVQQTKVKNTAPVKIKPKKRIKKTKAADEGC